LQALEDIGVLRRVDQENKPLPPLTPAELAKQPTLCDPADPARDVNLRARSYLHANCGHCHRFGGGGSVDLELHAFVDLKKTKALDVSPHQGSFDLPDAKVIAAGAPDRSTLYYRMAKFGRGRMPRMGSNWPDEAGLALIHDWIAELGPGPNNGADPAALTAAEIDRRLSDPVAAMDLA